MNDERPKEIIEVPPEQETPAHELQIVPPQSAKNDGRVVIGTLNVFNAPVQRLITDPLRRRHDRHYHPRHRHGRKHLIADIVMALAVIGLLAFNAWIFLFRTQPSLLHAVRLATAVSPETIKSGDLVTLTVEYANDSAEALTDATLAIRLPETFRITSAEPTGFDRQHNTFALGAIEPQAHGRVIVSGQFIGAVGTRATAGIALNYTVLSSAQSETRVEKVPLQIRDSALRVVIELPSFGVHEGIVPIAIRTTNSGQQEIRDLTLAPFFGSALRLASSSIPLTDGRFLIGTIPPGGTKTVEGVFNVFGDGEQTTTIDVRCFVDQQQICAEETRGVLPLLYPHIRTEFSVDGNAKAPFRTDGTLPYRITFTNGEAEDIVALEISLTPPTTLFVTEPKKPLRFTAANTPELAVLKKGASGSVAISLQPTSVIDRAEVFASKEPTVTIPVTIRYRLASHPDQEIVLERTDTRRVVTDLSIDAFARYFTREGDQIGRGPLPPIVDETTRYWAFLALKNSFSDLRDVTVRAHLPDHVLWTGKTSVTLGEPVQFDDRTRELLWRVGTVTRFTGGVYPDVGVAVELSLTPEARHLGTSPILIDTITVRGTDTFTNDVIERTGPAVTTNLTVDTKAKGKGTVVRD